MTARPLIEISLLKENEVAEADRILRIAFGTFLNVPDPPSFMGDRDFMTPRWRARHVRVLAARANGHLIGTNIITRWGGFGFFGPLTVLPEYWDRGVAQELLRRTVAIFDQWGLRHTGLFTFAQSAKHVALYQKFGYWPRYLTAVMSQPHLAKPGVAPVLLSGMKKSQQAAMIVACAKLTNGIDEGLDLTGEVRAVLTQRSGDVVLVQSGEKIDGFAICLNGPGSEGGEKVCYVKFGAARAGSGAGERFDRLLLGCEAFAASRHVTLEAGVNLAREDAFRRMKARGYRVGTQGVAMQRPHAEGFNRAGAYVIDDWR